jgi:diketogulonate reductase-like aldo/keto reductase
MTTTVTLNNGVVMPAIGLGVFQTPPEETTAAVRAALNTGYRHVDTAAAYGNEREAGQAIADSRVDRSEVFIETKVWISDYGYEQTLHAFDKSAGKLGVDQIDLLILHQALPSAFDRTIAAYHALERLLAEGKVRAIGVSNFMTYHLEKLLNETTVVPAVNQIECHPYFTQPDVQTADTDQGILTQAWSPIGGITSYRGGADGARSTFDDPTIAGIADQSRQNPGPGHAALGSATRPLGHPQIHQAQAHSRELRRLRLQPDHRPTRRPRRPRHGHPRRT